MVTTRHVDQAVGVSIEYDSDGRIRSQTQCAREVSWFTWSGSDKASETLGKDFPEEHSFNQSAFQ